MAMGFGDPVVGAGKPIEPMPAAPTPAVPPDAGCLQPCPSDQPLPGGGFDGLPEVEVLDRTTGEWRRLPHFTQGTNYSLSDPDKYVDPATGTIQVRFVNDRSDGVGMAFSLSIEGTVR
jgi:hypothetical protein